METTLSATTWTDDESRSWSCTVTVSTLARAREAGIDLLTLLTSDLLARCLDDPLLLAETLYLVCQPQIESRALSREQFFDLLHGDHLDGAIAALIEGLIAFSPSSRRQLLREVWNKTRRAWSTLQEQSHARLQSPQVDQTISRLMAQHLAAIDRDLAALAGSGPTSGDSLGS